MRSFFPFLAILSCQQARVPNEDRADVSLAPGATVVELDKLPDNHIYPGSRAPLSTTPLRELPLGSITAKGWLLSLFKTQARELGQLPGLGKGSPPLSNHVSSTDPSSLQARTRLVHVLDDSHLRELTGLEIRSTVSRQLPNGWIGPEILDGSPSWATAARVVEAIRDQYSAAPDKDLFESLRRYVRFQSQWLDNHEPDLEDLDGLADHTELILWIYNEDGDPGLLEFLAKLFNKIAHVAVPDDHRFARWREMHAVVRRSVPESKITNTTDIRLISTWNQWTHEVRARRDNDKANISSAESLVSATKLARITMSPEWGDLATKHASRLQVNFPLSQLDGVDQFELPYSLATYASRAWFASPGDGLVALSYVPCRVRAQVGEDEGTRVTLEVGRAFRKTDRVTIDLEAPRKVSFPLALRVPGDCASMKVRINGGAPISGKAGTFLTLTRLWRPGDRVEVRLVVKVPERI